MFGLRWLLSALLLGLASVGCAPESYLVINQKGGDAESETFGYRTWKRKGVDPDLVVIGIHGFCGASVDYKNLGEHLVRRQPKTAVYAYEVRGQGSDPIHERRGDIGNPAEWYADLEAFTQLVEERHPRAKIIWYGESMGALIATHALSSAPPGKPPCDGLVLSSPIVRFKDEIEPWKPALVQVAAATLPLARVPIDAISGGQAVQMTSESVHTEQSKTNSYNIEKHTLRLLATLAKLIDGMNGCAEKLEVPTLVLHGGQDFFNSDSDVRGFFARIPANIPATYRNYPDAHHLLMYDEDRDKVFRDVGKWLNLRRKD
ncbi:alpha/beta fold hydrolase [Akkermansiaceae bacterium]|nr:alpha/beta fold hydrolase [Akkermansiaceae bacterium]